MRIAGRPIIGIAVASFVLLLASIAATGCSGRQEEPRSTDTAPAATPSSARMVKRRLVRIGVTFSRTHYFVDQGMQRGVAYEYGKLMEDELNKRRKTGNLKVVFWFVPLPRDQLLPALVDGKVDMVIAQLTVTPECQELVDFTKPTRKDVDEVVVTGPGAPVITSVDDLAGQEVFIRKSSSYNQSLLALNERLTAAGEPPVDIQAAPWRSRSARTARSSPPD